MRDFFKYLSWMSLSGIAWLGLMVLLGYWLGPLT